MAAIRSRGTSPERRLESALRMTFPRRRLIEHPPLPGRPDYYMPGLRLAVFADGCFWHACPAHGRVPEDNRSYWAPKLARNVARDKLAMLELRRMGIRPLRLWDHELQDDSIDAAVRRILRASHRPLLQSAVTARELPNRRVATTTVLPARQAHTAARRQRP
jgi:DNA mismatch endonuclease (patch repair protein)